MAKFRALDPQDYLGSALIIAVDPVASPRASVKVKCVYKDSVRALSVATPRVADLRLAVAQKMGLSPSCFQVKYMDKDGDMIVICDDGDMGMAVNDGFLKVFINDV